MSGPAHSWTATMPLAAARSRAATRARARWSGVSRSRAARAHQVVGVGGQRALRVEARRGLQVRREPPQRRGRRAECTSTRAR